MKTVTIDFSKKTGCIKPVNAVNNGPSGSPVRKTGNAESYAALEIPYARNHDASFYSGYGGEHTVDVHRIFKNFDADENDPRNYCFTATDEYIAATEAVNTKTFYRLGASIEHGVKYGTFPPKDSLKWAKICEHIIRHYTEGWADGFTYDIRYWEIWNEPDCMNWDGSNPCWQGTFEEFAEFFDVAVRYLKATFPHIKIGGPAVCSPWSGRAKKVLDLIAERKTPLDFFSYHWYGCKLEDFKATFEKGTELYRGLGYENLETILNEWNYIRGWTGDDWSYSLRMEKGLKGSSFVAGAMCLAQAGPLDMLMYYDARPCGMCGLFDTDTLAPLDTYYTFLMFKDIRKLGTHIPTEIDCAENIYSCASTDGENAAVLLTHYSDDDSTAEETVRMEFRNANNSKPIKVEYYLLDSAHKCEPIREEIFTASEFASYLKMPLFSTYLLKITQIQ